jgi:hypothetical protein
MIITFFLSFNFNKHKMDDQSSSSSYSKELFKSSYKFISFIKQSSQKQSENAEKVSEETNDETIGEFYKKLIKVSSSDSIQKSTLEDAQRRISPEKSVKVKKTLNPKDFLKAAQNNDFDLIKSYLHSKQELNVLDNFKWNALMISTASANNEIVKYLLNEEKENKQYKEMVYMKDDSGSDAEFLASKFKNLEALELIRRAKEKIQQSESNSLAIKEQIDENKEEIAENFYCEKCRKLFDTNEREHVKSIAHQLNELELEPCSSKATTNNYYIRSSNKGYQLLLKSGWKESSGLGKEEQGELKPIKTKLKLDRLGLGVEAPNHIPKSKSKFIQLKTSQYNDRIESKFKRALKAKHKSRKN